MPKNKNYNTIIIILVAIAVIVPIIFIAVLYSCNSENFSTLLKNMKENFSLNETVTLKPRNPFETEITFKNIGNGVAIGVDQMINWLQPSIIDGLPLVIDENKDGENVYITPKQYRSTNGFIPPSFTFYPFGKVNTSYRIYNKNAKANREGSNDCMRMCADTNCIAVQTEVPELCAFQKVETPKGFKHACDNSSEAACTLFYDTIPNADDAYYKINKRLKVTGREDYMGEKYYILDKFPESSPSVVDQIPSEATVQWCPTTYTPPSFVIYGCDKFVPEGGVYVVGHHWTVASDGI